MEPHLETPWRVIAPPYPIEPVLPGNVYAHFKGSVYLIYRVVHELGSGIAFYENVAGQPFERALRHFAHEVKLNPDKDYWVPRFHLLNRGFDRDLFRRVYRPPGDGQ